MKGYLKEHPILDFKRGEKVKFVFEGKEIEGYEGIPIAAALHAAGVKVLSYSEKYDRPRGFFCAVGKCSSCLMEVDGRPNVMVCMEPLKAGMKVKRQKGQKK
jgi:predicted molibdopterin-dependent oxidoreductase YjgC